MSIKYGSSEVKEIYVGREPMSMVYAGRDLVWQLASGSANGGTESSGELDINGEVLNYDNLILWYNDGTIEQHAGLTAIETDQFTGIDLSTGEKKERLITHIHIPNTIITIAPNSLDNNLIEEIEIPGSVERVKEYAIMDNPIKKVILNEGLKYLAAGFLGDAPENIDTVYVPDSVEVLDMFYAPNGVIFNIKRGIRIEGLVRGQHPNVEYRP